MNKKLLTILLVVGIIVCILLAFWYFNSSDLKPDFSEKPVVIPKEIVDDHNAVDEKSVISEAKGDLLNKMRGQNEN